MSDYFEIMPLRSSVCTAPNLFNWRFESLLWSLIRNFSDFANAEWTIARKWHWKRPRGALAKPKNAQFIYRRRRRRWQPKQQQHMANAMANGNSFINFHFVVFSAFIFSNSQVAQDQTIYILIRQFANALCVLYKLRLLNANGGVCTCT